MLPYFADPHSDEHCCRTPYDSIPMLEFALQSGNIDIVRMFIEVGADVNAFDRGRENVCENDKVPVDSHPSLQT